MMNEYTEHKAAISGLETVTKIVFSYRMAEDAFFDEDPSITEFYIKAVLDLYVKVIEYQASAAQYFGKQTIERLGKTILLGSKQWANSPAEIAELDDACRRSLSFLGLKSQAAANKTMTAYLEQQDQILRSILSDTIARNNEVAQVMEWVSPIPYERDHADVRQKLGDVHFNSGHWLLEHPHFVSWKEWKDDCCCLWLCGSVGTGKSSLTSILIESLVSSQTESLPSSTVLERRKRTRRRLQPAILPTTFYEVCLHKSLCRRMGRPLRPTCNNGLIGTSGADWADSECQSKRLSTY